MNRLSQPERQRVLIASRHPLFGKGLRSLLLEHWGDRISIVGLVSSIAEIMTALETKNPDLVVVDYDDEKLNREEFLTRFLEGKSSLRVVLVSLRDGDQGSEATIYDRRTMSASQIDDWLNMDKDLRNTSNHMNRGENG